MKFDLYDFDGTIYDGDSGVDFIKFSIKKNKKVLWCLLSSIGTAIGCLLKIRTKEQMKDKIFRFVKDIDDVDKYVAEFWEIHEHKLKKFWLDKKDHSKDIIISASCRFWLQPIADKYKVYDLFATDIDMKTGKIIGNNCHGKEKVRLFYDKYPKATIMKMYTDSVNDLPLIEEAKEGILVKKNTLYNYYEYKPNSIVRFWRWGWGIYHKNEEMWNYIIVGGLTTVVSIASYLIFRLFIESVVLCNVLSWICAVSFAYITNRIFVFKSKSKKILKEIASFFGARLFSLGVETVLLVLLNLIMSDKIGKIIVQFIVLVLNYITSKLLVFRKEK